MADFLLMSSDRSIMQSVFKAQQRSHGTVPEHFVFRLLHASHAAEVRPPRRGLFPSVSFDWAELGSLGGSTLLEEDEGDMEPV